ncbi:PqqD family protein [Dokdonella sp.]|uniref:PqqD family protein n=1 Tax=Dokdonella sp. TaxID=2291710 RepID=UPI0031BDAEA0|nr:PqqD family protein [Dokdonella sp.]
MSDLAEQLRQADCTVTEMADGTAVVLDLRNEVLLTLNETAAFMLSRLRAGDDEAAIVRHVVERYEVAEETARTDVASLLAEIAAAMQLPA